MFKTFIDRPVLSTVISIIIVMLGILGLTSLPIEQYPNITPPMVSVRASYAGANAEVVLSSVIIPLEEQINGVEGMTYMTSSATNTGSGSISIYFEVGTDPDLAAVHVQNRVSTASSLLPAEVTRAGVTVRKMQSSMLLMSAIYSDDPEMYDEKFLQNYANINIIPQLQRVNGVGDASAMGSKTYAMRIWLRPDLMASYNLMPSDISSALSDQSIDVSPGSFGEQGNQSFQYVLQYTGKLKSVEEFENIIIRTDNNGQFLRLKDVARVELGGQSYSSDMRVNGKPATQVAISQVAGSNAQQVVEGSLEVLNEAAKSFPPGVHLAHLVNVNKFLKVSINKVIRTLIEAFILVFIIVYLFLQNFRATLIPAISVPVSIIGTFFFLNLFGFSINLLTLFALVLAIGIVVDDAIVVVEAVYHKIEHGYESARLAAIDTMHEIGSAIISITLVMASVFIPVTFIGGSTGIFFRQFGLTLAIAIIISALNALTLSPALAALFLRPKRRDSNTRVVKRKEHFGKRFFRLFNVGFEAVTKKYTKSITFLAGKNKKWIPLAAVIIFASIFFGLMKTTSKSFVPNEDMGTIFVNVSLPPSSSLERTTPVINEVAEIAQGIDGVSNVLRMTGNNMMQGAGSAYGMVILELQNWADRPGISNNDISAELVKRTAHIQDVEIMPQAMPTITGFGRTGGFEFQLQDKESHSIQEFYAVALNFLTELQKRPEIAYAQTPFNPNFPQYLVEVNVPKVKEAGLTVSGVMQTMQTYFSGSYLANFNQFGKQYRIMMQAEPEYRANPDGLEKIFIRNTSGEMAPISEFITLSRIYGSESISRFNMFTSISVMGSPADGYSSGQALDAIEEIAAQTIPTGYDYEFSGISREERKSGTQTVYIFALSILFVYFLLCALYESYILPLAVILSLPVGLAGTFVFCRIFGIDNNIYTQVSLIMLIGLLAKNAILIVEYALQRRQKGLSITQSAIEGAQIRLRPILMTSLAFIFGIMLLMFSTGAGANGNRSIGTSAVGGMLFGAIFGIFVIPGLFIIFQTIQEKFSSKNYDKETIIEDSNRIIDN